jgi:hypothetical protein
MAGLGPAIHVDRSSESSPGFSQSFAAGVDGRVKPGHDVLC